MLGTNKKKYSHVFGYFKNASLHANRKSPHPMSGHIAWADGQPMKNVTKYMVRYASDVLKRLKGKNIRDADSIDVFANVKQGYLYFIEVNDERMIDHREWAKKEIRKKKRKNVDKYIKRYAERTLALITTLNPRAFPQLTLPGFSRTVSLSLAAQKEVVVRVGKKLVKPDPVSHYDDAAKERAEEIEKDINRLGKQINEKRQEAERVAKRIRDRRKRAAKKKEIKELENLQTDDCDEICTALSYLFLSVLVVAAERKKEIERENRLRAQRRKREAKREKEARQKMDEFRRDAIEKHKRGIDRGIEEAERYERWESVIRNVA